jgi:hypothetical protein
VLPPSPPVPPPSPPVPPDTGYNIGWWELENREEEEEEEEWWVEEEEEEGCGGGEGRALGGRREGEGAWEVGGGM